MKAREGDLLETQDGLIFDVKGLVHPLNRIVAFPRFVPDLYGNRRRRGIVYKKVYALSERYELLEKHFPKYLVYDPVFGERLCEVPTKNVRCHYKPVVHLQELRDASRLDKLEEDALRFAEFLQNHSGVPWSKIGISGSLLAKLHTSTSDIDLIVYGKDNCLQVYKTLKSVMKEGKSEVKAYSPKELRVLYDFRSQDTTMSFNDFLATEPRKLLQGKFLQHDFYIRCIVDWDEIHGCYGDVVYQRVGYAKIEATISDDSEAIFTPCRYSVDNVKVLEGKYGESVTEIASFRGRFCEQARKGETVITQGKVERVQRKNGDTFFRLLLGGKPSDYMVLRR